MNRLLLLLLIWPFVDTLLPADHALVTVNINKSIIYIGMNTMISICVEVEKGYHIQANTGNDESLIPTTLEVKVDKNFTITKQEFPPSKQFKLKGTDSFLKVYDGKFLIKLFFDPIAGMRLGNYVLDAKLRYQACDSKSCFFPRVIDFSIPVEVKIVK